jgi:hypothetical protein
MGVLYLSSVKTKGETFRLKVVPPPFFRHLAKIVDLNFPSHKHHGWLPLLLAEARPDRVHLLPLQPQQPVREPGSIPRLQVQAFVNNDPAEVQGLVCKFYPL